MKTKPQKEPRISNWQLPGRQSLRNYKARHFLYQAEGSTALITLNRPERKNPLTFDSYAELRELFCSFASADDIKAVVISGAGENFCSGGDVHEIIGPLTKLHMPGLLAFTQLTGELVKAMRACPQPIVAAVDGVCAGAGAILALASDLRLGTPRCKIAFLFTRVGLAGCDMGACSLLPRIIGQGRAAELLLTGRAMSGEEAERWGFLNRLCAPEQLLAEAKALTAELASGPAFAHAMTKKMLHMEMTMGISDAIDAEAQAQAICMATQDFQRAYAAFAEKKRPVFKGD
jgi:enoyl-CoA hydratase/carnithine racemase